MPPTVQTIARFRVRSKADLDALRRILVLGGTRIGPVKSETLHSLRLDTRDDWFRRAGLTLRILRDGKPDRIELESGHWTTGQAIRRIRMSAPLAGSAPRFPGRLPRCQLSGWRARVLPDNPVLIVIERQDLVRESFSAGKPNGVRFLITVERTVSPGLRPLRRVELALESGMPDDLIQICRKLAPLPGWIRLADLEPVPASHVAPDEDAGRTLAGRLRFAILTPWRQIFAEAPGARAGLDPERIHRMRLSVRRLRSLARLLPPEPRLESMRLKPLGSLLGRIRDLDIGLGRLGSLPLREARNPAVEDLQRRLKVRRDRQHRAFIRLLDEGRFRNGATPDPGPWPNADNDIHEPDAKTRFKRQIRNTLKAMENAGRLGTLKAAHRLRIRGKQTRYILEALEPVLGEPARNAALALEKLHRKLGVFQDEVAFLRLLESIARQPRLLPPLLHWAQKQAATQAEQVERQHRQLHKALRRTGSLKRKLGVLLPREP